ncbi:MAG: PIN domain-containing protein [Candidatus Micrarchaeota archaeon]
MAPKRFYVNTSVWRDFLEDRKAGWIPLGELAFEFLKNCRKYNCQILVAEPVLFELKDFPSERVSELFASFQAVILFVDVTKSQRLQAKEIAEKRNLPFNDVFHAIIARDNSAILVSRDHHFTELTDIVEFKKPEEAIFE